MHRVNNNYKLANNTNSLHTPNRYYEPSVTYIVLQSGRNFNNQKYTSKDVFDLLVSFEEFEREQLQIQTCYYKSASSSYSMSNCKQNISNHKPSSFVILPTVLS